jgi:ElaB/YqjD/DUF883 family membrane-anchored ribosome-binding protein
MEADSYTNTSEVGGSPTEDVRQKAEETASTLVDQAQKVASVQANSQMNNAASMLDSVARTLYETGSGIRDQQPQVATIADQAAARVEGLSGYLRDHDLDDAFRDTEDYARRQPLVFLGAAFAVGFIAARFLKASTASTRATRSFNGNGDSRETSGSYSAYQR